MTLPAKFSDVAFVPLASDAVIQKAKEWLISKKPTFICVANYAVFSEEDVSLFVGKNCHLDISHPSISNIAVVATENGTRRSQKRLSLTRPFLDYFLDQSVYGRFILNREDKDFCAEYGFIVSADIPAPLLQNIMIVSRHFYEVSAEGFARFNKMVSSGVFPGLAYQAVMNTNLRKATDDMVVARHWGHAVQPFLSLQGLKNMRDGVVGKEFSLYFQPTNIYRVFQNYVGGTSIFLDEDVPSYLDTTWKSTLLNDSTFRDLVSARRKAVRSVGYKPPNPFSNERNFPRLDGQSLSILEFIEVFVPYIDNILKETSNA